MRKSVHTCRGGKASGYGEHHKRVVKGNKRNITPAHYNEFELCGAVGKYAVTGNLAGGAGGGVDRDNGGQGIVKSFNSRVFCLCVIKKQ